MRGNEWTYVRECLDTNWVSSAGPFVQRLERDVARWVRANHAVATVSGTAALHIALLVAGVEPDDEVLIPALTFIAPANAVRYVGAHPVFMDADPEYWQMDLNKVRDFIAKECLWKNGMLRNRTSKRRVKAILPVHVLGHPVEMGSLLDIAAKYELPVIEDATEALGSEYRDRPVGVLGDIGCVSFNGNKIITTGGGGMIVTNNSEWASRSRYLTTQAKDDPVEYIHNEVGYNYRLSNVLAAIGVAQVEQLPGYLESKRKTAQLYSRILAGTPGIRLPEEAEWAKTNYWQYAILVDPGGYGMGSRELMNCLSRADVQSRPLWHPIHSLPPYRDCQAFEVKTVDRLYERSLCLPSSVGISERQIRVVADLIRKEATRETA